jgi:uncharacterized protein
MNRPQTCPYIFTVTGRKFMFDSPTFDIEEIAHALSMQCRFTGHVKRFYSVAEHCILVSQLCRYLGIGSPLEGLLHDGQEAYLSDIASPWKALLPDYKRLERRIEAALRENYSLPAESRVKHADKLALFIEAHHLLTAGTDGLFPEGVNEDTRQQAILLADTWEPFCYPPFEAKEKFMAEYRACLN